MRRSLRTLVRRTASRTMGAASCFETRSFAALLSMRPGESVPVEKLD